MKIYVALWLATSCPGGWLSGLIPNAVKPLICAQEQAFRLYDPARRKEAEAHVRATPGASLHACRGSECRRLSRWVQVFE